MTIKRYEFAAAFAAAALGVLAFAAAPIAAAQAPAGSIKGTALRHTPESLATSVANGALVLPPGAAGDAAWSGKFKDAPAVKGRYPAVIFLHGSSGLGLKAIGEWQLWLAGLGVASLAPDSFALPDHVTYTSPIDKATYEQIHALRASEIPPALAALQAQPWVDPARLALAGTSEGSVPVARYPGKEFAGRILYAWSCESNYFVTEPRNAFEPGKPVLNVISTVDPFFSAANAWLGNPSAKGHCGEALKDEKGAAIVLVPGAPHTLLGFPAARHATAGFIAAVLKP